MTQLLESKTMRLVLLTMLMIVAIFTLSAILDAAFGVRVPYVSETFAALTGNSGIGAARNAYVDGPIRRDAAAATRSYTGPVMGPQP